jgi:aminopeptidase N
MSTLTGILSTIDENVTTDTTRPKYRTWVRTLLATAATAVGWSDTPTSGEGATDDDDRRALRATVITALGKTGRDAAILAKSRQLVEQDLASPGSLDPTLLNVVVNLAALEGGAALYEKYLARSQAAVNPEERYRYLYGLANFSDPALARRTMDYALGPGVRSQDTKLVIAQLLANEAARDVAWHLLRARWDDVQRKTGEFVGNTVIVNALSSFCDSKRVEEIKEFFATHKVLDAERTLSQALDRIRSCAGLAERERPRLAEWLEQHH